MENENKKSKKGLIIAIIAIIIIAIVAGVACYFFRPRSPKDVFIGAINDAVDSASTIADKSAEKVNKTITLSGNLETTNPLLSQYAQIINNGKITLNIQADTNAKKFLVGANVDYQNENYINAKAYYQNGDNNLYLYVQDLFDKYLKISIPNTTEEGIMNASAQVKDMNTASKIIKDTIAQNLKDEYFSKEQVNGRTKNTIKLTTGQFKEIYVNIFTTLKNNQNFLNCFENPDKVLKTLEEALDIKETDEDSSIELSLYTKGKEIDEVEFKFDETITGTIKMEKIDANSKKATILMDVKDLGKVTLNIEVKNSNTNDLDSVDTANAVDLNNMTQPDMMKLYTNLTKMKIYSFIAPFLQEQ